MSAHEAERPDPGIGGVVLLMIAAGGLAMCITLLYNGMRGVMDVGGFCAEGGPYVIEQHCPEGAIPATLLGIFGLFAFIGVGMVGASRVGGYGWLPIVAWTGLFAVLGWNFLDYGLLNPPDGEIQWGWVIPGIMFELMAWVPAVLLAVGLSSFEAGSGVTAASRRVVPTKLRGPGQPARDAGRAGVQVVVGRADLTPEESTAILRDIATAMGTAITEAAAETPADPARRAAGGNGVETEFAEGTQALLDRLERLADMRDRGLLAPEEYETAKDAVLAELEKRS